MGRTKITILLILAFFSHSVLGQNTISGKIEDKLKQPLVSASVILKDSIGKIVTYTFSDDLGKYSLKTDKMGKYILSVTFMGFEQENTDLILKDKSESIKIDVVLLSKTVELEPIVIKTVRPITIDGDKIIFDAKSFSQGDEQVIEDLLKKIPGLNVSSDGTIKFGNQEVEKVMINNDDMFDKGYKILTKNMPVNPINKIELLQNYSNNKHLKGIENSDKVALNLTLKEDFERQWFGNLQLGYGLASENRYEAKGNLMNFGNKSKYYFLTNLNNIGYDAVGDIDNLIRPIKQGEPASLGDNQSAYSLLKFGEDLPNLKKKRINLNNAKILSLNSIFTLSEKVKLKVLGFLNTDENDFYRTKFQSFSTGTSLFENKEDFFGRKTQLTGFGKIDLTYDISNKRTLEYTGKLNKSNFKDRSDLIFNGKLLNEKLNSNNLLIDQKLVFTNRFKDNKVLLMTGRYINEETPQNYMVNQFIFSNLFSENADNISQFSKNKMQFYGFEAHLLDKKENGSLLEIKIGNQLRIDNLISNLQLKNDNIILSNPIGYQNNNLYSSNDLYLSGKYRIKLNKFSLFSELGLHQLFNSLENTTNIRKQNPFFINPKIGFDLKLNEKNKIISSYSFNTTNATILDIYENFIQTGFRSFTRGNNDFNQLNSSNAILNYTYGNWGDKFFANTFILYSKYHDFFSTNSVIAQNYTQSEKILTKDRDLFSVSSNIDRFFSPIKSNLKLTLGYSHINFKNIVNNSNLREIKNNNVDYGFELRSAFKGVFNYHFGSKWNNNKVSVMAVSNSFTDNMTFLDLSFRINEKMNFQIQSERYYFGNLDKSNNTYYFLDLEGKYVLRENKITLYLSGNNLFNIKAFENYNITDISVSKTVYRLQSRYVLLKLEYRF